MAKKAATQANNQNSNFSNKKKQEAAHAWVRFLLFLFQLFLAAGCSLVESL
jgi:hypothetical protein